MLNDQEYRELQEDLTSPDVDVRAVALREIAQYPSGDERVIALLKEALDDANPCVVSIPYLFGEVRYLAAVALRRECEVTGAVEGEAVYVTKPLTTDELSRLNSANGIRSTGGLAGLLKSFATLREMGKTSTIEISY